MGNSAAVLLRAEVCESILLLGVTALCCYSIWRRHTEKS